MPGWFTPVVIVLGLVALGCLVALWTTRKRKYAVGFAAALALLLLAWLIAYLVPTDQKRLERAVKEMAAGVEARDANRIFAHIAREFKHGPIDRTTFRHYVEMALKNGYVDRIAVWDFEGAVVQGDKAMLEFQAKPLGGQFGGDLFYRVKAEFVREEGQWRLKDFNLFNPLVDQDKPIDIPGLR